MPGLQPTAKKLAKKGRNGDNTLVHMSKGEVRGLQKLAKAHGTSLTKNPETGLDEAFSLKSLIAPVATIAGSAMGMPWLGAVAGAVTSGGGSKKGGTAAATNAQAQQNAILQDQWNINKPALTQGVGTLTKMTTPEGVQTTRNNMLGFVDNYGTAMKGGLSDFTSGGQLALDKYGSSLQGLYDNYGAQQRSETSANIANAIANQNAQRMRANAALGVNPNSGRFAGMDRTAGITNAALMAGGQNAVSRDLAEKQMALRSELAGRQFDFDSDVNARGLALSSDVANRRLGVNDNTENMFWGRATDLAKVGQNAAGAINTGYANAATAANDARRLDQAANTAQGSSLSGLAKDVATTDWSKVGDSLSKGWNSIKGVFGWSEGGPINGPGTETSDSIPARLSDGEYVLNAEAVKLIGKDKLDAINHAGLMQRGGARGLTRVERGVAHAGDGWFVGSGYYDRKDKYDQEAENKRRWDAEQAIRDASERRAQGTYDKSLTDRENIAKIINDPNLTDVQRARGVAAILGNLEPLQKERQLGQEDTKIAQQGTQIENQKSYWDGTLREHGLDRTSREKIAREQLANSLNVARIGAAPHWAQIDFAQRQYGDRLGAINNLYRSATADPRTATTPREADNAIALRNELMGNALRTELLIPGSDTSKMLMMMNPEYAAALRMTSGKGGMDLANLDPSKFNADVEARYSVLKADKANAGATHEDLLDAARRDVAANYSFMFGGGNGFKGGPHGGAAKQGGSVLKTTASLGGRSGSPAQDAQQVGAVQNKPWYMYDYRTDMTNDEGTPNVIGNSVNGLRNWFAAQGRLAQGQ